MDSNPELFPENVINETRESLAILFPTENQSGAYLKKYNPEILKGSDYPFGIPQRNWNDISVWRARMGEIYSIYLMPTTTLWGKIHDQRQYDPNANQGGEMTEHAPDFVVAGRLGQYGWFHKL